jgi:DNA invertase Pin-like site-specific DNA recombinase
MKIGYAWVKADEQLGYLQIEALKSAGCERIYLEKCSQNSKQRPELELMIEGLKINDIVVVQRLDRLGRSLKGLIELLDFFKSEQIQFISLNEGIDTTSEVGELAFHMITAIAQFERKLISERAKAALEVARARGRRGGRKKKLSPKDIKKAKEMLLDPEVTKAEVAECFKVSRPTLNKALSK